ncbi:BREX-1 system phosphatase PglZ type A [Paenibacillus mesophilus]|uniref:BREX-1 system phosphatase PglZ type A n=1 Tax=Paenibacillus mesophilus TaxID=2582849 RepID=UPI00110D3336|nr:BREX-1 system phosphatase PglZ type A [Paenibacillus mesophilus]TMV47044.1 BREX-1 system phosphatase PglZ type A [Paenibacillus mesophilus]
MAELNLKQIADKLNAEFSGGTRKLVFWYDEKAEFADDIHTLELSNAKVYYLEPDNQFYSKYFLERLDQSTNYLIYAPFPKPVVRDNHLADTIKYSKEFFADRVSLLTVDLGIDEKYKSVIQKYIKFFGAKDRTQRFYDLEIENFTRDTIEIALMSALCKTRTASFEEVVRVVLTDSDLVDNKFLVEFEKYDLLPAFWRLCEEQFGYSDVKPTLEKLVVTMFVTYTERYMDAELPKSWKSFVSYKSGNIIAFLDNLMNSLLYRGRYNELSEYVAAGLNAANALEAIDPEDLLRCDTFAFIDRMLINWITERLLVEDTGAKLNSMTIPLICEERSKMYFGGTYKELYQLLEHAYYLILEGNYKCPDNLLGIVNQYRESDYLIDTHYRCFYTCLDKLKDNTAFEQLRDLIENIYTNEYLEKIIPKWNAAILNDELMTVLPLQRNFYSRYILNSKERVVVIISDALRYETGRSLWARLQDDEKCTAKLESMLSVMPSYTRCGMAALLPHRSLEMTEDYRILVDGTSCDDLKQRERVLQRYNPNSRCIQYDDIKTMKRDAIRQLFVGMDVIYIYHNQIDARGDKPNTENEVFVACEEAMNEIHDLIKQLTDHVSATHYIVTADHGFIYKRDKLQESDKIVSCAEKGSFVNRRFIVSDKEIQGDGIGSMPLSRVLGNNDTKIVSFPISSNVFKVAGGGQNYVHGGSSPQEMIVPVLDIKTEKGHKETRTVEITLVSMVHKISNLITTLDFIQNEPVSDVVKGTSYKISFISDDNEKISNENIYIADKKDVEPQKRIFRLRFNFKNKKYDKSKRYYLVAYDEKNDLEVLRHDVIMDIAFANDFGFNV